MQTTTTNDLSAWLRMPHVPANSGASPARFTLDGDLELERHLLQVCQQAADGISSEVPASKLEAILLGGGYGRGEGGVHMTESGDRPYNDMEFYVCIRGQPRWNESLYGNGLRRIARIVTASAGIEVEFKIISVASLRNGPVTMFSYDLVLGHRWVAGDERLLEGCEHHRRAENIPLSEATRLLMNRCSGLLYSRQRLEHETLTEEDVDFINRNCAKARLALGDAVLTAYGEYHWSCLERQKRLGKLNREDSPSWLKQVREEHAQAVEFKLHPKASTMDRVELHEDVENLIRHAGEVWLWLESRRLGEKFSSPKDYAFATVNKCSETRPWKNFAINLLTYGPKVCCVRHPFRYPRERLFNSLALILWERDVTRDPCVLRFLQGQLQSNARTLPGLVNWYQMLWSRFR